MSGELLRVRIDSRLLDRHRGPPRHDPVEALDAVEPVAVDHPLLQIEARRGRVARRPARLGQLDRHARNDRTLRNVARTYYPRRAFQRSIAPSHCRETLPIHASATSSPADRCGRSVSRPSRSALGVRHFRAPANAWSAPGARSASVRQAGDRAWRAVAKPVEQAEPRRFAQRGEHGWPAQPSAWAGHFRSGCPSLRYSIEARCRAAARAGRRNPIRRSRSRVPSPSGWSRNSTRVRGAVSGSSGTSGAGGPFETPGGAAHRPR